MSFCEHVWDFDKSHDAIMDEFGFSIDGLTDDEFDELKALSGCELLIEPDYAKAICRAFVALSKAHALSGDMFLSLLPRINEWGFMIFCSSKGHETMSEEQEEQQPDQDGDAVELNFTVEFSEAEHRHYMAIRIANEQVMAAQRHYDNASAVAKSMKKELELASLELSTLISRGPQIPDPQKELPFSDDQDAEAWKDVPVSDVLKLTDAQKEKLIGADITTMGRLEFVRAGCDPFFPNGLRSIKGFGEKTIDAIENDIVDWLAKNVREQESDE